jgi:hypothetical protein
MKFYPEKAMDAIQSKAFGLKQPSAFCRTPDGLLWFITRFEQQAQLF